MPKPKTKWSTTVTIDGHHYGVMEGDYPEVAQEVKDFVRTQHDKYNEALHEFLEERAEAAPSVVDSAHLLTVHLNYYVQRWLLHHEK